MCVYFCCADGLGQLVSAAVALGVGAMVVALAAAHAVTVVDVSCVLAQVSCRETIWVFFLFRLEISLSRDHARSLWCC